MSSLPMESPPRDTFDSLKFPRDLVAGQSGKEKGPATKSLILRPSRKSLTAKKMEWKMKLVDGPCVDASQF